MINEYINSSKSLISFIENSQDPWGIKDLETRCVYANKADLISLNLPENFNYEGTLDQEIPSQPCQELWEEFNRDDRKVLQEGKKISGVEVAYYGKNNKDKLIPRYFEKYPLFDDEKKIIGLIFHTSPIDISTLLSYMNRLNKKTIQFDAPNDLFTKRELEVIFWSQQRLSAKEISKRLGISDATVENHMQSIYKKANIHNSNQLIEYCKNMGLDQYIPSDFIKSGVILVN